MRSAFVVVVGIADLQTVNARLKLACVFDTDQVAEFVGDYVGKPTMATADFKVPVGEPEVDRVFAWNGVAVTVKGVVERCADAAG